MSVCHAEGFGRFLGSCGVLYKSYEAFVTQLSERIKDHAKALAQTHQRPYRYLESAAESKEQIARGILEQDGIEEGLVCVLACIEPCRSFELRKNAQSQRREPKTSPVRQAECILTGTGRDRSGFPTTTAVAVSP